MRRVVECMLVAAFLVSLAHAGELYGTIQLGDRAIGGGIEVVVTFGRNGKVRTVTDEYGSYSVRIPKTGPCRLSVRMEGQNPSIALYSYARSVRYDLILEKSRSRFLLRRDND